VYRWEPFQDLVVQGRIFQGFPAVVPDQALLGPPGKVIGSTGGPNFVFGDRAGDFYYLGIASDHWGWGQLLRARDTELFPRSGAKPSKTGRLGSSPPRQQGGHA
jgi:hypothetical protein